MFILDTPKQKEDTSKLYKEIQILFISTDLLKPSVLSFGTKKYKRDLEKYNLECHKLDQLLIKFNSLSDEEKAQAYEHWINLLLGSKA